MQGIVFNSHYYTWMDIAHTEWIREVLGPLEVLHGFGVDVVVAESSARYFASARFDQEIDIEVRLESLSTTAMTTVHTFRHDEELLAEGRIRHVCVDTSGSPGRRPRGPTTYAPPSPPRSILVVEERAPAPVVEERAPASVSKPPDPVVSRRARSSPSSTTEDWTPSQWLRSERRGLDLDAASGFHHGCMTATNPAIEVAGLTKAFGDNTVLDGVDLTVPEGTVYALLGPNGAGKTTIVNILSTLLTPDDGEIRVAGFDVRREPAGVRAAIGVTGQFSAIDELLTGRENLRLMADLAHLDRTTAGATVTVMLERFDLLDAADRRAQTYSGGMKRRLDLAMTLIARPRLIFLDEPTTRSRPAQPARAVGDRARAGRRRRDGAADDAVPRRGRPPRRPDRGPRRWPAGRRGHGSGAEAPGAGRAGVGAVHRRREADRGRGRAPGRHHRQEALTLQVPNDGTIAGLRRVLDGLDDDGVAGLTVASTDLDDVFLALTGHAAEAPASMRRSPHEHHDHLHRP